MPYMRYLLPICLSAFTLAGQLFGQSYTFQHSSLPCLNKKFTIVAHIFRDSTSGTYGVSEQAIQESVESMNMPFSPICVSFEVCQFIYHDNFEHDSIDRELEMAEIAAKHNVDYRINVYYVKYLGPPQIGFDISGLATLNGIKSATGGSYIFLEKTGLSSITHEMGHYFNLLHTFEGSGTELVNGSNCETEGDQICDTPADPFVQGDPLGLYLGDKCRFISEKRDRNGEYYNPDVGNIMSYYGCGDCGFTWGQLNRMAQAYLNSDLKYW